MFKNLYDFSSSEDYIGLVYLIFRVMRQKIKALLSRYPYFSLVIRSLVQPRNFHIYCIGAAKTGTKSIANIFSLNFRSGHEPMYIEFTDVLERRRYGEISDYQLAHWFRKRDWMLWLECESSHPLAWFCDILNKTFTKAKFILTVRDCYSWLDSIINQHLNYVWEEKSIKLRNILFDNDSEHETSTLKTFGLYTLNGYLSYWADLNNLVLKSIPAEKLLVVPTHNIINNIESFANFAGVTVNCLDKERYHSHKVIKKHNLLDNIDRSLIADKIKTICKPVIERLNSIEYLEKYDFFGLPR